jgi:hypothetical protein
LSYRLARGWQMLNPTGCPYRGTHSGRSELANIFGGGGRGGEFDCDVDTVKSRTRKSGAAQIILTIEFCAHIETVFGTKLLYEAAHLSVSNDGRPRSYTHCCAHCEELRNHAA